MTIAESTPIPSALAPGRVVHGYVLSRPLGAGGFGEVWLADRRIPSPVAGTDRWRPGGERVALKFARGDDPKAMEALFRESRLMERLTAAMDRLEPALRPPIIAMEESLLDRDPPALAMEYARGGNLRDWMAIRGECPSPVLACRIARDIAAALAFAHAHGVAHRDLSPENVLRSPGTSHPDSAGWKVADFGLGLSLSLGGEEGVRSVARSIQSTGGGDARVAGKLPYMAPEVLAGKPARFASDLYALGVIWSQLLLGRMDIGLSANWASKVPAVLLPPLERCLEYHPEQRWDSADRLVEALDDWLLRADAINGVSAAARSRMEARAATSARPVPFSVAYQPDDDSAKQTTGKVVEYLSSAYSGGRRRRRPAPALPERRAPGRDEPRKVEV